VQQEKNLKDNPMNQEGRYSDATTSSTRKKVTTRTVTATHMEIGWYQIKKDMPRNILNKRTERSKYWQLRNMDQKENQKKKLKTLSQLLNQGKEPEKGSGTAEYPTLKDIFQIFL
jgi:hypothetical protein